MDYLLLIGAIAAGMCVGFLLIVLAGYLFIRFWLKRVFTRLTEMAETATMGIAPFMQPLRIKLHRELNPQWDDRSAVQRVVKSLEALGLEDAGVFVIDELPDMYLQALVQPETHVYAVVYEHPDKGIWFEFVSRYEDGASLCYSTAEETGLDRPPNKTIERFTRDVAPEAIYQQLLKGRPAHGLLPASRERFQGDFEQAYADEMDWRFERGGFTEDEIRNNLKHIDGKTTDQQIKQVHAMQQAQVAQWLHIKLQENFRARANISDAKWRQIEASLIFVHDRLSGEEVHGIFTSCLNWEDEEAAQTLSDGAEDLAHERSARDAFRKMVQMFPPASRAVKKLGHVAQPVAADVYVLPRSLADDDG